MVNRLAQRLSIQSRGLQAALQGWRAGESGLGDEAGLALSHPDPGGAESALVLHLEDSGEPRKGCEPFIGGSFSLISNSNRAPRTFPELLLCAVDWDTLFPTYLPSPFIEAQGETWHAPGSTEVASGLSLCGQAGAAPPGWLSSPGPDTLLPVPRVVRFEHAELHPPGPG